jgi:hypothetical protein
MPFDPIYSPTAAAQFNALPVHIQKSVLENIERLADDPVLASAPPSGPLWPLRQLFFFDVDDVPKCRTFVVPWKYHADEVRLCILAITEVFDPPAVRSGPH